MKKSMRICGELLLAAVFLASRGHGAQPASTLPAGTKVAVIVIQNSSDLSGGRVMAAINYAQHFKEAGADVQLYFDAGGVEWLVLAYSDAKAPRPAAKANAKKEGQKPRQMTAAVDGSGKAVPLPPEETPEAAPVEEKQPDINLVKKITQRLNTLATLGVPINASGRSLDRHKVRDKLRGKPVNIVNEPNQPFTAVELTAQGYKIFLF